MSPNDASKWLHLCWSRRPGANPRRNVQKRWIFRLLGRKYRYNSPSDKDVRGYNRDRIQRRLDRLLILAVFCKNPSSYAKTLYLSPNRSMPPSMIELAKSTLQTIPMRPRYGSEPPKICALTIDRPSERAQGSVAPKAMKHELVHNLCSDDEQGRSRCKKLS